MSLSFRFYGFSKIGFVLSMLLLSACATKVDLNKYKNVRSSSVSAESVSKSPDTQPKDAPPVEKKINSPEAIANENIPKPNEKSVVSTQNNFIDPPPVAEKDFDISKHVSVYFDFDRFDVKPEYNILVLGWSRWMSSNSDKTLIIQGNTDERGGREYNLALGQKRAEAVVRALTLVGADANKIEAISFGKEKPVDAQSNESAWAKNRRADIVVK